MILAICGDKHAPGVTTLATALSVVWPIERVLLEADPSGGDLAFRLRSPSGGELAPEPTVMALAADAREALPAGALSRYAQATSLQVPVLLGPLSAEGFEPVARLWPQVAAEAERWSGTVIADLGRLQLRNAASPVAAAATSVLMVMRAGTREDLFHGRHRASELAARLGQGPHGRSPLSVVVVCPAKVHRRAVSDVQQLLASNGATSTIPVAGYVANDTRGLSELRTGVLSRRLMGSDLLRSARSLAETLVGWWPQFSAPAPPPSPPPVVAQTVTALDLSPSAVEHVTQWGPPARPYPRRRAR